MDQEPSVSVLWNGHVNIKVSSWQDDKYLAQTEYGLQSSTAESFIQCLKFLGQDFKYLQSAHLAWHDYLNHKSSTSFAYLKKVHTHIELKLSSSKIIMFVNFSLLLD